MFVVINSSFFSLLCSYFANKLYVMESNGSSFIFISLFSIMVTVVLLEVNNVYNIHSRVQSCPVFEYVLMLNNFSHLNGVALKSCG